MFNIIAATAAILAAPIQDEQVKLERLFKAGDIDSYSISAHLSEGGGMEADVTGKLLVKVLKDTKDGKTEIEFSTPSLSMVTGGADAGLGAPAPLKTMVNKNGMPAELEVKDEKWIYVLASISAYLPAAEIKVGGEFTIDWTSDSKAVNIKGKGFLEKTMTVASIKIAVIKTTLVVTPSEDEPGNVELTSKIDTATGKLLSSEGKVRVSNQTVFTFKMEKEKK